MKKKALQCSQSVLIYRKLFFQKLLQNNQQLEKHGDILRLICDQCSREIINSIQAKPKSAIQISNETNTEISTIYRRLHKLQKHHLLKTTFQITPNGKKSFYYQSKINSIIASYQQGKFNVSLDFNKP